MVQAFFNNDKLITSSDFIISRNLLENSEQFLVDVDHRLPDNNPDNIYKIYAIHGNYKKDDKITISFTASTPTRIGLWTTDIRQYSINKNTVQGYNSLTFTCTSDVDNPGVAFWAGEQHSTVFKHVMVQKGSKSTIWVPAPEDLGLITIEKFNDLKSKLGGVKLHYRLYTTSLREVA